MERRQGSRQKRRVICEIEAEGRRHRGIVLDVSPRGLFVQTDATPGPGTPVRLTLRDGDGDALELDAQVARKRLVPRRLASVATGGIGLRIASAPEEYFRLLSGEMSASRETRRAQEEPSRPEATFRVRVKQVAGPRSRSLLVNASGEDAARRQALAELGEGWSVLEVSPA